jgi:putative transposase
VVTSYRKQHPTTPIKWLIEGIKLSRNGWYHQSEPPKDWSVVKVKIEEVLSRHSYYGHKKVTKDLQNQGIKINHKTIYKIMGYYHLLQVRKKRNPPKTTNSKHRLYVYQNEVKFLGEILPSWVWVSDITYIPTNFGWVYLSLVMDVGTRRIVGWALKNSMQRELCMEALTMALKSFSAPKFHHSDRGVQYCSYDYINLEKSHGITPSMADVGVSVDNPFAESLNRSIKVEEVYRNDYETLEDARRCIGNYISGYNTTRLHSSLGYKSPMQFEEFYLRTVSKK